MAPVEIQSRRNKLVNSIDDENCWKLSFIKRKSTLKKKAAQLSTLCDVNVCMVCVGPDQTVETWPENRRDVLDLIFNYKRLREQAKEKGKQKYNLTGFLRDKKRKREGKLNRITVDEKKGIIREESMNSNLGGAVPTWDEGLNLFSDERLVGLCSSLDSKLQELREKIKILQIKEKINTLQIKEEKDEIENHKVRVDPSNLNNDLRTSNGDYFHNQQINWPIVEYHGGMSSNPDFGRPENLPLLDENHNNNHVGIVNINNYLPFNKNFSSSFNRAIMGLNTEGSTGLMGESSNRNNYFQSDDHQFMLSRISPASLIQNVLPISLRPSQPFSHQSA